MERYRLQEWLNFVATELHKTMSPLYNPKLPDEIRQSIKDRLASRLDHVEGRLSKSPFLMGSSFSVADAYLFTVLRWTVKFDIDLARWPGVVAFMGRMQNRPAVQAVLKAEGLS
jgi:glutathione S-transferase